MIGFVIGFAATSVALFFSYFESQRRQELVAIELLEGPGYGLKLADRIYAWSQVRIHSGDLYPALRSLEARGLVESEEKMGLPCRGPARAYRVYRLTSGGRTLAKMWRTHQSDWIL